MKEQSNVLNWMIDSGCDVIRYRTAAELARSYSKHNLEELERDLLKSVVVRYWLCCLNGRIGFNDIHGSRDTCFENAIGKLTLLGVRQGMGVFDRRCKPYLSLLRHAKIEPNAIGELYATIVASLLAMAGHITESVVRERIEERLDTVYSFVRNGEYSIHVGKSKFKNIPSAFKHYSLIDPDLYVEGRFALPLIYDLFSFSVLLKHTKDRSIKNKIGRVISYILDPRYQRLPDGYGIVLTGKNRYNVMGWNVWLPGYDGMHSDDFKMGCLVQRLELLSRFPGTLSHPWFIKNMDRLESFAVEDGKYTFPKQHIQERRNSYFVAGGHMGLGEDRRRKLAYTMESTFWMNRIMSNTTGKKEAKWP
jgi:hypothetical protein